MPFDDLREWIAALERAGELKRIQTEADPILEIAEITDRVSKVHMRGESASAVRPGGPALLFQNVKGHPGSQLLINQFGSDARMKLAVGVDSYDEIAARLRMFMDMKSPQGFLDKLKMLPLLNDRISKEKRHDGRSSRNSHDHAAVRFRGKRRSKNPRR